MLLRYAVALVAFAALMCFSLVALGVDPASQAASQPVASSFWSVVVTWLAANWQYIVFAMLIPSIIVGCKSGSVKDGFMAFLDKLSVTTAKDSPGTFKLPFSASKPPEKK
jgi:hypothetical protein